MGLCKLCNSCYLEINGSNLFGLTFPIIDFQMWVKNFSVCLSWRICIFMLILFTISKSFRISRKLNCWELLLFMEILSRTIPSSDHFWQVSSLNCKKLIQLCSRKDKNREDKSSRNKEPSIPSSKILKSLPKSHRNKIKADDLQIIFKMLPQSRNN